MAYSDIKDPSAHFQATTYAGDSNNSTVITNDGNSDLQADLIWLKNRTLGGDGSSSHMLFDSSRGIKSTTGADSPYLHSDSTAAEDTNVKGLQAVSSNGFTPGYMSRTNKTSSNFVAWQWKATGGTTASNTSGTITSTVQANQDAGFSIITYTGTGANATVGHGLGVIPDLVIYKNRIDNASGGATNGNWIVQSSQYAVDQFMTLNTTAAVATDTGYFRGVRPSSTVLTLGVYNSNNGSNDNLVAYAFASKQGYSKFGTYEGNSNANGPFIYTGFKPTFIIVKPIDIAEHWVIHDNKRDEYNGAGTPYVFANESEAETASYERLDFLSNGFKIRVGGNNWNPSSTVLYMAFAENPFVAGGVPTTAR